MNILFISAPFGPFFATLAGALETQGCRVWRTVSEGGDWWDTPRRNRIVVHARENWSQSLSGILESRRIDTVVTFNDTSPRNRDALRIGMQRGLKCWVLENGYLRPHFITCERDGVNGHSGLPRSPDVFIQHAALNKRRVPAAASFPAGLRPHVVHTIVYNVVSVLLAPILPFDRRYYGDCIVRQAAGYVGEYVWRSMHSETRTVRKLRALKESGAALHVVILQKPKDGQIRVHSPFNGNTDYLEDVLQSFARAAAPEAHLVVKQHPLDYGIEQLPKVFARNVARLGLVGRATYIRKTSIEQVLDVANTVVTMNSTAGLTALQRLIPTICLGDAFYDMPGLTHPGPLDAFWCRPTPPRRDLVEAYVDYLRNESQINGGFHTSEGRALLVPALVSLLGGAVAGVGVRPSGVARAGHAEAAAGPFLMPGTSRDAAF